MKRTFRFPNVVNNIPLNYKFMLIYVVCVLLPIAGLNIVFMERMSGLIMEREEQNLQISLERARKDIQGLIEGGVAVSHALNTDKTLYEMLDRSYEGAVDFYDAFNEQLRYRVTSYIPVNNQIARIGIYTDNPTIVQGSNYFRMDHSMRQSEWYQSWQAFGGPVTVTASREPTAGAATDISPYLSVVEEMNYFDSFGRFKKLARIDFELSRFNEVMARERDYLSLYLVNDKNEVIVSGNRAYQQPVKSDFPLFDMDGAVASGEEVHVVSIGGASYIRGWKLMGVPQGTRVSKAMLDMRLNLGLLALTVTLVATVFIFVMLRSYNYRVKRLSRHMHKVTNEKFDLIKIDEGRDEIGHLIRNFNVMTSRMNSLINNVYKLEIQQKSLETERVRAELNFLQSQMNPHFLFNTLNALLVVSAKNNYTDVKDIIKGLSKLLRRLLNWKEDLITLGEEVHFTEMYLEIEKFRFRDKFSYRLDVAEEALSYKIPKMSIQQLAENACKHGIQPAEGEGTVSVAVSIAEERLRITVEDNGKGMTEERLREIVAIMHSDDDASKHIGIRNVFRRLELYYRDSVMFTIVSKENEGTKVSYEIPVRLLEEPVERQRQEDTREPS